MLSIQDLGLSILGDNPKNFYILGGSEYGIKDKYIEILSDKIGSKMEYDTVLDVITLMSKYHIIPLQPKVYVVRYDKSFISLVTKDIANKISNLNIVGTIVLIYEDEKDLHKLDKFFPDNTATIDAIDVKHMVKYLRSDFPELDKKTAEYAANMSTNYYQAKNICRCLDVIRNDILLTESQMISLFGLQTNYSNDDVQVAIASRNFNALMHIIDHYDGDLQNILYLILRVMVELDKCFDGKYVNSPVKKYAKNWTKPDVYFMFNHTYAAIKSLRSGYTVELSDLITYLGALMMFKNIPDTRLLK
jgi:hypothetical protein